MFCEKKLCNHYHQQIHLLHLLNGYSLKEIKKNLEINFPKPISKSDEFLINDLMSNICPEFGNKKIFEN